jgi:hypothetical protein
MPSKEPSRTKLRNAKIAAESAALPKIPKEERWLRRTEHGRRWKGCSNGRGQSPVRQEQSS